ncbi:hypothetical protein N665_0791s0033 [Sinapis alba]|nr:hypothetical protein N665_0791s0033 [Sinapis alba]
MKTISMFLTVIVLVSSGKLIFERTHILNPTTTPPMNVQITDLREEHVKHINGQGYMGFCYDCAWACYRKNKNVARCKNFICRCTISDLH